MVIDLFTALVSVGTGAVVSLVATGLVLCYARRRLIDAVTARSSHAVPTPRGGGLGLVIGVLVAVGTAFPFLLAQPMAASLLLAGVLVLAAVGWWDDHGHLPARVRLAFQVVAAVAVVAAGEAPDRLALALWSVPAPWWVWGPLAVLGTVWMINLTNFMDGIDGIAGSQGLIAAGAMVALAALGTVADVLPVVWATALVGGCAGFLVWNLPPARIFMGDVGSTVLGLLLAILVMALITAGQPVERALLPVFPFVADATVTLGRRAWRRERLSEPHRSHLYQRLSRHWGSHRLVTLLWSGGAALGSLALVAEAEAWIPPGSGFAILSVAFAVLVAYGRRIPAA